MKNLLNILLGLGLVAQKVSLEGVRNADEDV